MATITPADLRRLLRTLPQELYDEIHHYTFTASPDKRNIDKTWRQPHLLQVDRASRHAFAASYFSATSTFIMQLGSHRHPCAVHVCKWLTSRDPRDLRALENIHVVQNADATQYKWSDAQFFDDFALKVTLLGMIPRDHPARALVFKIKVVVEDKGEEEQ